MEQKTWQIFLVEDNAGDVNLIVEALRGIPTHYQVQTCRDGMAALAALKAFKETKALPDFIILDLNIPGLDGFEILSFAKGDMELRRVPVVVFSSSDSRHDILRSYQLGANCYVQKPFSLDKFFETLQSVVRFWSQTVKLSENPRPASDECLQIRN